MGMLNEAKKEHGKKKKHPAAEESAVKAPGQEPADSDQSGDSEGQSDEGGEAADPAPAPTPGAGPGAGGTPDAPQAGANQGTQQGSDQGNDSDAEGDDSDDDQQAGGGPQDDQDGAPSGGDASPPSGGGADGQPSGDDSAQAPGGQPGAGDPPEAEVADEAKQAGGSLQEFKNAVGPNGEPNFSKIPLPPALSEELDKAKAAIGQALYSNEKVATAVLQSVVPGDQLPSAAAHMTLVIVSSINKQLLFSKNAPQLVLPIVQLTLNHILDMVEQVRKVEISDQQAVGALGLAQEGVMRMFGVSKQQVANLKSHLPPSMVSKYQAHYKNAHQYATSGQQGGGPGAEGPSGAASPGGSAPGSPAGAPSGGGMVSQGAQAAQSQGGAPAAGGAEPAGPSQEDQEEQE